MRGGSSEPNEPPLDPPLLTYLLTYLVGGQAPRNSTTANNASLPVHDSKPTCIRSVGIQIIDDGLRVECYAMYLDAVIEK